MQSIRMPYQEKTLNTPAARIKQARIAKNMLIKELSEITGISTTSISKLENRRENPSLRSLQLLSRALDVPISYLGCFEHLPQQTIGQRIKRARLELGSGTV